jgi:hypothetical protein
VIDVLGHEAAPPALEKEHVAPGMILHQLIVAPILEYFVLKVRLEGRLAPAKLPQAIVAWRIEVKQRAIGWRA